MKRRLQKISLNTWVLITLVVIAISSSVWSAYENPNFADREWRSGWLQNFSTEMMGAIVTFLLFELLVGGRRARTESEKAEQALKARLVSDAGSRVNGIAIKAVEELQAHGWLEGGGGLLQEANLYRANLQGVILSHANLQQADLQDANLQQAILSGASLQGANLEGAILQAATLSIANLQEARLVDANLQGAYLLNANLQEAKLMVAKFDENVVLPDNTKWTQDTDMSRFTNPDHPDFWQPEWVKSRSEQ